MQITHQKHPTYEQVVNFDHDDFHCTIAIHSTKLGPAIGGCRIKPYLTPADSMLDALRLAKGMSYKCSLANLDFGGGKAVIAADCPTRDMMLWFGDAVNYFKGDYITAEDVGTTLPDMQVTGEVTSHCMRIDGSEMTARGVLAAMLAAAMYHGEWGDGLDGVPIWVQGLGKVGMPLVTFLTQIPYANVYVSDLQPDRVAQACAAGAYALSETDRKFIAIYAPCALGQVINTGNVNTLTYSIICGAANNQLADDSYADLLRKNSILYLPDYLVNAGGVINGACEVEQPYDKARAESLTDDIGSRVLTVLEMARTDKISPLVAANRLAEARL